MKYTIRQKILREEQKARDKTNRLEYSLKLKKQKLIETSQKKALIDMEKINKKINNERKRKMDKIETDKEKNIKNLEREEKGNKKVVYKKKPKGLKYYKDKATTVFQLYIRLRDCDDKWYGRMIDTKERRRYNSCQGGHYFPKQNYPQLVFNEDNVHAQTGEGNYKQMDKIGLFYEKNVIEKIGQERYDKLREVARDDIAKEQARNRKQSFYEDIYNKYHPITEKLIAKYDSQ